MQVIDNNTADDTADDNNTADTVTYNKNKEIFCNQLYKSLCIKPQVT